MVQNKRLEKANKVLDEEIAALRQQVALAKKRRSSRQPAADEVASGVALSGGGQTPTPTAPPASAAPAQEIIPAERRSSDQSLAVEFLDATAGRLVQIKNWLNTDHELLPLVAKAVGDLEGKYLRRNLVLNVVLSTIFLIAGWLLSNIATPSTLAHIFRH